jgi:hypothetical protein
MQRFQGPALSPLSATPKFRELRSAPVIPSLTALRTTVFQLLKALLRQISIDGNEICTKAAQAQNQLNQGTHQIIKSSIEVGRGAAAKHRPAAICGAVCPFSGFCQLGTTAFWKRRVRPGPLIPPPKLGTTHDIWPTGKESLTEPALSLESRASKHALRPSRSLSHPSWRRRHPRCRAIWKGLLSRNGATTCWPPSPFRP